MPRAVVRLYALFVVLAITLVSAMPLLANEAEITKVEAIARNGRLYLNTDVNLEVQNDLKDVVMKGVPVYFTANAEIIQKRWWWFDKTVVKAQLTWRIMYNALTRQWRVSTGDLSWPEANLDDALSRVRSIRGWSVLDLSYLEPAQEYHGRVRLRLDTSLLARPFQVDALNSSAWSLATPWKNFTFSISAEELQH